jgi:hypothetical protein
VTKRTEIRREMMRKTMILAVFLVGVLSACAGAGHLSNWHDESMDFGSVKTVAVMPFANLSPVQTANGRVRDTFMSMLMATGGVYVLPPGEVARGIARVGVADPTAPSPEEVVKLCGIVKADAVITGVVKEYGEVRAGATFGNVIALNMNMLEGQSGKVVWTASAEEGGISLKDRLLGPSGAPLNDITVQAVNDLINKLFK